MFVYICQKKKILIIIFYTKITIKVILNESVATYNNFVRGTESLQFTVILKPLILMLIKSSLIEITIKILKIVFKQKIFKSSFNSL